MPEHLLPAPGARAIRFEALLLGDAGETLGGKVLIEAHAAGWRFGMQLEPSPVEVELVLSEQPDQAASLCDVAEGSDEIRVQKQFHDHSTCKIGAEERAAAGA